MMVAYRNKTYVAFDGDNDIRYYWMMKAWKQKDNTTFNFYNAHDLNSARDTSKEESIKRQLRERMNNSKVFVLLIGKNTRYLRKFVKWEIESAIRLGLPIICVNLNGNRMKDDMCPPILNNELAIFIPYEKKIMQFTLENWPSYHTQYKRSGNSGDYHYENIVYDKL
ncbi:TIR domain-containing protein [Enterococcus faecium]|nr:TIR domain-containing protein [Enterococcus faecium]MDV4938358.1 TIR domain-containing protein [Enterococcus faecium]